VTFTYDSVAVTNGKGRLTGISDGAGSTVFEYDPMGRVSRKRRTTLSVTVQLDYTYNRMGGVKRTLVPELGDTTVDYAFDNAGRQRTLSFNGGSTVVVGDYGFTYGTNGATESFDYGNGVWESISYNERLQPVEQTLGYWWSTYLWRTYQFDAPGGGNNGNVWGIADHVNAAYTQQFDYDFRNRITLFTSNGLGSMTFEEYDRWGGRTGIPACPRPSFEGPPGGGNPRNPLGDRLEARRPASGRGRRAVKTSGIGFDLACYGGNERLEGKDLLVSAARRRKTWYGIGSARCGGRIEALFHEAVV
jgi:YD repeat-containing protein